MRDDRLRLRDILAAITKIRDKAAAGREAFFADEMLRAWVVLHVQIIGEAASRLAPSLKSNYPQVPWAAIADMRNVLVHAYFGIDYTLVWQVVENELDRLEKQVTRMLNDLGEET